MMNFFAELIEDFIEVFLGWIRKQGHDDALTEVEKKHDEVKARHDEIDRRPLDPDGALSRLRDRRRLQDIRRPPGDKGGDGS